MTKLVLVAACASALATSACTSSPSPDGDFYMTSDSSSWTAAIGSAVEIGWLVDDPSDDSSTSSCSGVTCGGSFDAYVVPPKHATIDAIDAVNCDVSLAVGESGDTPIDFVAVPRASGDATLDVQLHDDDGNAYEVSFAATVASASPRASRAGLAERESK